LGLLALGSAISPGYVLSYDMVFVPSPPFNTAMFGLAGTLPRDVPSDATIAILSRVLPADLVQKIVLLSIFALACSGAARLLANDHVAARLIAGICYTWNPFVAERLILGQWALLLGYAGLPWVVHALTGRTRSRWRYGRLAVALLPAAVAGFAAMCVSALVVIPVAAMAADEGLIRRVRAVTGALAVVVALSLPWLVPSLARVVHTNPAAVAAFAARADTPFGTVGSLFMLGGAWNAQTVPFGYGGAWSALWLLVVLVALAGFTWLARGRWPGLGLAAIAGLAIASVGIVSNGRDLLMNMIGAWPGFAVLRDGQQFVGPLALAEALGLGLAAGRWITRTSAGWGRDLSWLAATMAMIAPVVLLPGLAFGAAGRLRSVEYPADWLAARHLIDHNRVRGSVLVLPWAAYRRFGWNHGEAMLDPWPRLLALPVIWNDSVTVGNLTIPPESPQALELTGPINSGAPLTMTLLRAGVRFVVVDSAPGPSAPGSRAVPYPYLSRLPGCRVVFSVPGLVVYQLPRPATR